MKQIQKNDFFKYQFLSGITYSPNGNATAVTVSNCNAEENSYNSNIWVKDQDDFYQLTTMDKERSFIWKDDETILFPSVRSEADKKRVAAKEEFTPIYEINIHGGEARKSFELPFSAQKLQLIKKDLYLVTGSIDCTYPDYYRMSKEDKEAVAKAREKEVDYEVLDELPFWFNGGGFINKTRTRLFLYNAETNKCKAITSPDFDVSIAIIDDDMIYYVGANYTKKREVYDGLYRYNITTKETTSLYDGKEYFINHIEAFDDSIVLFASKGDRYGINENTDFYLINKQTLEMTCLAENEESTHSSVGSDCRYGSSSSMKMYNNVLYFVTTRRNASHIYSLTKEGVITPVLTKEGSVDGLTIAGDSIACIGMYDNKLQECYTCNLTGEALTQVSNFNTDVLSDVYVARPEKITITSGDLDIDGFVLRPYEYNPSKTYPAILNIHGGPKTVYGEVFYHEMQYWANLGYFVFFCNPKGSDGRGRDFADIRGKYGTVDYQNIMDFTDAVLEKYPQINTNRIGVTGGSYGGFMTNWIIGHTNRFACAASQRSISNWISFYGTSDIGYYFAEDQNASNIYESQEKLWWHSPLRYANQVTTPTLFIHSNEDYRCPMSEGMQMYTALMDRGIDARLCYFKGENHELSRSGKPLHRERRLKEITKWMDTYLKK